MAGTTYWYRVQAISGSSSYLDSNYSTPNDRTCDLPQPTGVKATKSDSTGKVKITWNKVSGADKYNVYCSTDGGSTYSLIKTVSGTSLTHASATLGTTCRYKIMAVDSDKSSANSAYSSVVKGTATCAAPTITLTNVASSGKVKIIWEKVTGAKSYEVYRSADGSNWTLIKTVTGTSLTNTSANAGETWYYRVRAIGTAANSNSSYSTAKYRTCDLPAPTVSISANSSGQAKLTWKAVTGAVQYKVYCSTDKSSWTLLKTVTGTSLIHASAVSGTTYYYRVMAVASNSSANSPYSTIVSMTSK